MKNLFKKSNAIKDRDKIIQKIMYYFVILSSLFMLIYGSVSLIFGLKFIYTLIPLAISALYIIYTLLKKDWKMIWMYVSKYNRGRLMLFLNSNSHFEYEHKLRFVKWVYPSRKEVRNEEWLEIGDKVRTGQQITKKEKNLYKRNVVTFPLQLKDGFNEALSVHALIYAHRNINYLDDSVRDIFELTDENINKFNLKTEKERCTK